MEGYRVNETKQLPGISDMALYLPRNSIESSLVVAARASEDSENGLRLLRALEYTGQRKIRFNSDREDSATMAAEAARRLVRQSPETLSKLRFLVTGTETGLDHSKPLAAWVQGMLEKADMPLPGGVTTSQTQHACAGGTIALLATAAQLAVTGRPDERGLVICTDIARYQRSSTAEITQGAGAVALLVEPEAKLVGLDLTSAGHAAHDVDDFFRPLGSETAVVKGRFSIRCYREALEEAFLDHATRLGETPAKVLDETDIFVLHVPYYSLPLDSLEWLIGRQLGISRQEAATFLAERGYQESILPSAHIGNLYSGSMYMALIFALEGAKKRFGESLAGRQILFASYGSGNTMIVFRGTIADSAAGVMAGWNTKTILGEHTPVPIEEYERWMQHYQDGKLAQPGTGDFYLERVREDGYREYAIGE